MNEQNVMVSSTFLKDIAYVQISPVTDEVSNVQAISISIVHSPTKCVMDIYNVGIFAALPEAPKVMGKSREIS